MSEHTKVNAQGTPYLAKYDFPVIHNKDDVMLKRSLGFSQAISSGLPLLETTDYLILQTLDDDYNIGPDEFNEQEASSPIRDVHPEQDYLQNLTMLSSISKVLSPENNLHDTEELSDQAQQALIGLKAATIPIANARNSAASLVSALQDISSLQTGVTNNTKSLIDESSSLERQHTVTKSSSRRLQTHLEYLELMASTEQTLINYRKIPFKGALSPPTATQHFSENEYTNPVVSTLISLFPSGLGTSLLGWSSNHFLFDPKTKKISTYLPDRSMSSQQSVMTPSDVICDCDTQNDYIRYRRRNDDGFSTTQTITLDNHIASVSFHCIDKSILFSFPAKLALKSLQSLSRAGAPLDNEVLLEKSQSQSQKIPKILEGDTDDPRNSTTINNSPEPSLGTDSTSDSKRSSFNNLNTEPQIDCGVLVPPLGDVMLSSPISLDIVSFYAENIILKEIQNLTKIKSDDTEKAADMMRPQSKHDFSRSSQVQDSHSQSIGVSESPSDVPPGGLSLERPYSDGKIEYDLDKTVSFAFSLQKSVSVAAKEFSYFLIQRLQQTLSFLSYSIPNQLTTFLLTSSSSYSQHRTLDNEHIFQDFSVAFQQNFKKSWTGAETSCNHPFSSHSMSAMLRESFDDPFLVSENAQLQTLSRTIVEKTPHFTCPAQDVVRRALHSFGLSFHCLWLQISFPFQSHPKSDHPSKQPSKQERNRNSPFMTLFSDTITIAAESLFNFRAPLLSQAIESTTKAACHAFGQCVESESAYSAKVGLISSVDEKAGSSGSASGLVERYLAFFEWIISTYLGIFDGELSILFSMFPFMNDSFQESVRGVETTSVFNYSKAAAILAPNLFPDASQREPSNMAKESQAKIFPPISRVFLEKQLQKSSKSLRQTTKTACELFTSDPIFMRSDLEQPTTLTSTLASTLESGSILNHEHEGEKTTEIYKETETSRSGVGEWQSILPFLFCPPHDGSFSVKTYSSTEIIVQRILAVQLCIFYSAIVEAFIPLLDSVESSIGNDIHGLQALLHLILGSKCGIARLCAISQASPLRITMILPLARLLDSIGFHIQTQLTSILARYSDQKVRHIALQFHDRDPTGHNHLEKLSRLGVPIGSKYRLGSGLMRDPSIEFPASFLTFLSISKSIQSTDTHIHHNLDNSMIDFQYILPCAKNVISSLRKSQSSLDSQRLKHIRSVFSSDLLESLFACANESAERCWALVGLAEENLQSMESPPHAIGVWFSSDFLDNSQASQRSSSIRWVLGGGVSLYPELHAFFVFVRHILLLSDLFEISEQVEMGFQTSTITLAPTETISSSVSPSLRAQIPTDSDSLVNLYEKVQSFCVRMDQERLKRIGKGYAENTMLKSTKAPSREFGFGFGFGFGLVTNLVGSVFSSGSITKDTGTFVFSLQPEEFAQKEASPNISDSVKDQKSNETRTYSLSLVHTTITIFEKLLIGLLASVLHPIAGVLPTMQRWRTRHVEGKPLDDVHGASSTLPNVGILAAGLQIMISPLQIQGEFTRSAFRSSVPKSDQLEMVVTKPRFQVQIEDALFFIRVYCGGLNNEFSIQSLLTDTLWNVVFETISTLQGYISATIPMGSPEQDVLLGQLASLQKIVESIFNMY